jgi:hypothetical protein
MRYHKKDPLRETIEQVVAEKITPLHQRAEEMMAMLRDLACFIVERGQNYSYQTITMCHCLLIKAQWCRLSREFLLNISSYLNRP